MTKEGDRRQQATNYNKGTGRGQGNVDRKNFTCFNCGGEGHYSRDCPSGDSFPRGRKPGRGRGASGGRRRFRGRGRGQRNFHEVEEEDDLAEDDVDFSSLTLNSISVDERFPDIDSVRIDMLNQSKRISKRFVTLRLHKPRCNRVQEMKTKVDTSAEANVMPLKEYRRMCPRI